MRGAPTREHRRVQPVLAPVDPWRLEILLVSGGSRSSTERASISRDVERGLLLRLRPGAYVERTGYGCLSPEQQHVVHLRAAAATSDAPLLVSHWSAAIAHGLPVLRSRLGAVHVTVPEDADRHRTGLVTHHFLVEDAEVVRIGDLVVTSIGRTVLDVAGGSPFEEGVMAADAALLAGVPREVLEASVELAGARRASRRIGEVVAFADPGAESAAESRLRVSLMRLGVEVPELQRPVVLRSGRRVHLDAWLRTADVGIEVDGEQKYLDAAMAPAGAGRAVIEEKRREDEVRLGVRALVRVGWVQTGNLAALRAVLARVGVRATRPRTTLAAYCERARHSRPRRPFR
jgi:hypothetical protein